MEAVRRFNRFYTRQIGVLNQGLLESAYSLTEVRILYELAHRPGTTATELGRELRLDPGYLSRILRRLERARLIRRQAAPSDRRQQLLQLSRRGEKMFRTLDARAHEEVAEMLRSLPAPAQDRLVKAMRAVEDLLAGAPADPSPYLIRPHQPGDMGWVVHRHGVLYAAEYGWNEEFEALVADIVARFVRRFDPRWERCWIAERNGEIVGSVFLVRKSSRIAQLRLLLVEPSARGLGIGRRLVEECIRFARLAGYRKITLWTNDVLHSARRIYEAAGFGLVSSKPHHSFGKDLVAQVWELKLDPESRSIHAGRELLGE